MKKIGLLIGFLCSFYLSISQKIEKMSKPLLTIEDFDRWQTLGNISLSNDGKFVQYTINNFPVGESTLVIKEIENDKEIKFEGISAIAEFTHDSKRVIFTNPNDSLYILDLLDSSIEYIPNITAFNLFQQNNNDWLACLSGNSQTFILKNLLSSQEKIIQEVERFWILKNKILLEKKTLIGTEIYKSLVLFDPSNSREVSIWTGLLLEEISFDKSKNQFSFIANDQINNKKKSIWYYKTGMEKAIVLLDDNSIFLPTNFQIEHITHFNRSGEKLFFQMRKNNLPAHIIGRNENDPDVDIWSYTDAKLLTRHKYDLKNNAAPSYSFALDLLSLKIVQIEDINQRIISRDNLENYFLVSENGIGDIDGEWYWNPNARSYLYLISTINGTKTPVFPKFKNSFNMRGILSPEGQFVVYYSPKEKNYFSVEVSTGIIRNITKNIATTWTTYDRNDEPFALYSPIGIAGFLENDKAILIYDQHDIWKVDLRNESRSTNITNFMGKKNNTVFYPAIENIDLSIPIKRDAELVLCSFNRTSKSNGFYKVNLKNPSGLKMLSEGNYLFYGPPGSHSGTSPKSIFINGQSYYIARRMTASESPNYYLTSDFKEFKPLTNVFPEKSYNWLTSELFTWKTFDSKYTQGILYKPENFNPEKKYPVIFQYYERKSDLLHEFIQPELMYADLNIPYFVSNGYLVFVPDIHYQIGEPGESAYNAIVSAAKNLCQKPWVDSRRMGLQGHSFGGFETNYVITHCNLFAAAQSAAGMSNFISCYGSIVWNGTSRQRQYDMYRDRIGATLWKRPDLYIKNSPVLKANKITTPVLLMHNKDDGDVPFAQSIEFFTALRRLGKKSWMLQYDKEGHSIWEKKNQIDYTIKTEQFFDHYLKGLPAPNWLK